MKYLITYWVERNDEATDIEIIINASSIEEAKEEFEKMPIRRKKQYQIITYDL